MSAFYFVEEIGLINIALLHLIPILVVAVRGDLSATMIVTTVSVLLFNLLFIPPLFSFHVHNLTYIWSFLLFYVVGYIISSQAKRLHSTALKDILLSTLSHDLKTPISSIMGHTHLLLRKKELSEDERNAIVLEIKHSSHQMNRLILNLLDSARLQHSTTPLRKTWCDFEDIIGIARQEFDNEANFIDISIPHNLSLFWGDEALLTRMVVNLVDNGLKYSTQNSPLRLTIEEHNDTLTLMVFNSGFPIKKSDLRNMFEKFHRLETSSDIGGSGMGLWICHEIAHAHNGTIHAQNVDGGVEIIVKLPILRAPNILEREDA